MQPNLDDETIQNAKFIQSKRDWLDGAISDEEFLSQVPDHLKAEAIILIENEDKKNS